MTHFPLHDTVDLAWNQSSKYSWNEMIHKLNEDDSPINQNNEIRNSKLK